MTLVDDNFFPNISKYLQENKLCDSVKLTDFDIDIVACKIVELKNLKFLEYVVNISTENKIFLLNSIIMKKSLKIFKYIYEKYTETHEDFSKETKNAFLVSAIGSKKYKCIDFLLEKGASFKIKFQRHRCIRSVFVKGDCDEKMLKFLLERGETLTGINIIDVIMYFDSKKATLESCKNFIKILLDFGKDINYKKSKALTYSVTMCDFEIVKFLVENGANIHVDNETPLKCAVYKQRKDVVQYFLEKGAFIELVASTDINIDNSDKETLQNSIDFIRFLLQVGVDVQKIKRATCFPTRTEEVELFLKTLK